MRFLSLDGKYFYSARVIIGGAAAARRPQTAPGHRSCCWLLINVSDSRTPKRGVPTSPLADAATLLLIILCSLFTPPNISAQTAVNVPRPEEKERERRAVEKQQEKKAQQANIIEFRGQTAFDEKTLRSNLKEEITTIDQYGLTPARGDDAAFFLQLFYRKQGYAKAEVHYAIQSSNRLRLDINEGPLVTLGVVNFVGNRS